MSQQDNDMKSAEKLIYNRITSFLNLGIMGTASYYIIKHKTPIGRPILGAICATLCVNSICRKCLLTPQPRSVFMSVKYGDGLSY